MPALPKHNTNHYRRDERRVNAIRTILPLLMFLVVVVAETREHLFVRLESGIGFHMAAEIMFFGVLGPAAVYLVLSHTANLLRQQQANSRQLEALNRQLEEKVAERAAELAQRNQELALANRELQQLDDLKSAFVSLVSHELRAPLTTLNGGLEMVLQDTKQMPAKPRRVLLVLSQECERLTRLVQTILNVSQIEAGRLALNMGPLAVVPLLNRALSIVLPGKSRPVLWQIEPNLPPVWADETYLEEIVRNLLSNADKYSPPEAAIIIAVTSDEHCINISVIDHGAGIPPEQQGAIFDRFFRAHGQQHKGWGLGLYFSRQLAEAQGGKLTFCSPVFDEPGAPGTAFIISLPITGAVPEEAEVATSAAPEPAIAGIPIPPEPQ